MCSDESDASSHSEISESSTKPIESAALPPEAPVEKLQHNTPGLMEGSPFKMQRYGSSYEWQYYEHLKTRSHPPSLEIQSLVVAKWEPHIQSEFRLSMSRRNRYHRGVIYNY